LLAIACSLLIIVYTYFKVKKIKKTASKLVYLHWQLSLNRYKILVIAYLFYFLMIVFGTLISAGENQVSGGINITYYIFTILGVVPLFFSVLVATVLGSGSAFNAGVGEIEEKFAQKYAP
jgi:hypothetical protein